VDERSKTIMMKGECPPDLRLKSATGDKEESIAMPDEIAKIPRLAHDWSSV
jgi:hypothetical protein